MFASARAISLQILSCNGFHVNRSTGAVVQSSLTKYFASLDADATTSTVLERFVSTSNNVIMLSESIRIRAANQIQAKTANSFD